jgi:UDP-glucose 4-epimerase
LEERFGEREAAVKEPITLVTGANGFMGSWVVKALCKRGIRVRAGIHRAAGADRFMDVSDVKPVVIDILDQRSLLSAVDGVDSVYHFAAMIDPKASKEKLTQVNMEGTRNVWHCAAALGVRKALYCSSAAVYGLLARSEQPISEEVKARAVEPYGRSKLMGESIAREIEAISGPDTVIIRPVAVFGPGDHTPFGQLLRSAAVSKLLLGGTASPWSFSFTHVEDVAEAAVHLMHTEGAEGHVFNIAADTISFHEAFRAYLRALGRSGSSLWRARLLAQFSELAQRLSPIASLLARFKLNQFVFPIWRPGFDITYTSRKLLDTSFRFKWDRFEDVLLSCIDKNK